MATALKGAEKDINNATKGVDKFSQGLISAGARLKQIKNELNNFKGSESRFIALNREAAKLTDQIQKTNQRIAVLASSTRNFQAIASAVSGLTGIFTAAQGATAVFGKESEGLQRSLVKLQGSLALLQGVQAAVATVTEQSAAKTVLAEKAQAAYNFVVGNSTGALKGFKLALAATGIGLALIGIAKLVQHWDDFTEAIGLSNRELEQNKKFQEEAIKSYSDEIANVQVLRAEYDNANTSQERRVEIIQQLKEINPAYFGDLSEEKGLYVNLSDAVNDYIEALKLKGLNEARLKRVAELSEQIVALQQEEGGAGAFRNFSEIFKLQQEQEGILSKIVADQQKIKKGFDDIVPKQDPVKVADKIFPPGTEAEVSQRLQKIRDSLRITDPESLLFAQLTNQAELLEVQLEAIRTKTDEIRNLSVIEPTQLPEMELKPGIDLSEFELFKEELLTSAEAYATFGEVVKENSADISQSMSTIFANFSDLAAEGSRLQISMSIASILAANAEALANAIKSAMALGYPANIPATLQSVALVTSMFAQVKTVMNQAKAAQAAAAASKKIAPNVSAFAEGEVDIHRPGERRGKDSIPAMIMPGESVLTAEKTRIYKPLITAIHEGNIEDLIRINYIEPALALKALDHVKSDSTQPDYSDKFYRQLLELKEGNGTSKKVASTLARIENKLSMVIPNRYI